MLIGGVGGVFRFAGPDNMVGSAIEFPMRIL
jgi:hypothetical protein